MINRHTIRHIIKQGGPTVHYQPIVSLSNLKVIGFEALSRFVFDYDFSSLYEGVTTKKEKEKVDRIVKGIKDESGIGLSPEIWFITAAALGLGQELELSVFQRVIKDLERIPDKYYVSVNCSPDLVSTLRLCEVLEGNHQSSRIIVEITEHSPITDYGVMRAAMDEMRVRCSSRIKYGIDDVAAGSSSMMHLVELGNKLSMAKLDRKVVSHMHEDAARKIVACSLIDMGNLFGFSTVAEGIELRSQLNSAIDLGFTSAQGWLFGRPASLENQIDMMGQY